MSSIELDHLSSPPPSLSEQEDEPSPLADARSRSLVSHLVAAMRRGTKGSIRLDLRRPVATMLDSSDRSLLRLHHPSSSSTTATVPPHPSTLRDKRRPATLTTAGRKNRLPPPSTMEPLDPLDDASPFGIRLAEEVDPTSTSTSLPSSSSSSQRSSLLRGARLKITRSVILGKRGDGPQFPPLLGTKHRPPLDLGIGLIFSLSNSTLSPIARARFGDHVTIAALPRPSIKIQGQWPIFNTGMQLTARYACPLDALHRAWQPPASLLVRIDHQLGRGFHFSPFGLDFDEKFASSEDQSTHLRVAASVAFPRQVPLAPEEALLKYQLHRLGLKTAW